MTYIRRIALVLTVVAPLVGLSPAAHAVPEPPCLPTGHANLLECTVPTADHDGSFAAIVTRVNVLVPSGGTAGKPVVYLLHGVGDTYESWVANTDVETFVADPSIDAVIVMPDGGKNATSGWYSDWVDGSRDDETFHHDVLIPWIESTFQTATGREHRAVMGLSMGGFGALSYAGRHPDTFSAAASFSGFLDTQMAGPADGIAFDTLRPVVGTPAAGTWGSPVLKQGEWSAHNPTAMARIGAYDHLEGNLWLTSGTGTPGSPDDDEPSNLRSYAVEQYISQTNESFASTLTASGTPFHDLRYDGGQHTWSYWARALHDVLPQVIAAID